MGDSASSIIYISKFIFQEIISRDFGASSEETLIPNKLNSLLLKNNAVKLENLVFHGTMSTRERHKTKGYAFRARDARDEMRRT